MERVAGPVRARGRWACGEDTMGSRRPGFGLVLGIVLCGLVPALAAMDGDGSNAPEVRPREEPVHPSMADPERTRKAELVLRVERLRFQGGSKYWWYEVKILAVIKNRSGCKFEPGQSLKVAVRGIAGERGVPHGQSTIYLERYNPKNHENWKLLGGGAEHGVSHVVRPEPPDADGP